MKKKLIVLSSFGATLAAPFMALAVQTGGGSTGSLCTGNNLLLTNIQGIICKLNNIIGTIIPFLIGLGVIYFIWGVISYVIASDEEAKKAGRNRIIYGIIGLVAIVGIWGLVSIVTNTFALDNQSTILYPTVPY